MDYDTEPLSVLIVDDSRLQRQLLEAVCLEAGYRSTLAHNGIEAVLALKQQQFDLIITDLEMPKMDGLQLLRELSALDVTSQLIIVSSQTTTLLNAAKQLAKQFGLKYQGVCQKPFIPDDVLKMLNALPSKNRKGSKARRTSLTLQETLSVGDVRKGIENGALRAAYQAKVHHTQSSVIGFECLARWDSGDGKILGPGAFIPVAEQVGLIEPLTDVMLQLACADLIKLQKAGHDVSVSVNICTDCLKDTKFPDRVLELVRNFELDPRSIILEITETKVIENASECLEVMSRLRMKGFGLSVDDFGTGYSTLKQLQYYPFTELKLDRSYVAAAVDHANSRTVLSTGIQLAKNLSLTCIAEGVETAEQAALLTELGCTYHQGFLYARPQPIEDVLIWLAQGNSVLSRKPDAKILTLNRP